ncbi:peptidyl-prolyl cis-trans isomerase B (cyclophilin B) [Friedmanniella endophytica]|uniref:Peptidyl-prolyl cis-trans isomerase n=1 Tax=Microlunatus kandeliicorticis TaxID=1759536 RepID=A0A7W3IUQ6_9ACTN|nr:peptidylprolyl isomerase [Microlunatus kandeliicorticis]MBA8795530.1 peptidyl-prolyl cis-trans isomerase B (cyclophilin B) [Microlunatus kandeliicorticis]
MKPHVRPPVPAQSGRPRPRRARRAGAVATLAAAVLVGLVGCGTVPSGSSAPGAGSPAGADGGKTCTYTPSGSAAKKVSLPPTTGVADTGSVQYAIKTNDGTITIAMDRSATPCTINSFVSLARQQYFDDTRCHRLTTAGILVLQCGDPTATGSGGPGYRFPDELTGKETYPAGTVAMANAGPDTNGSQFFLVYGDSQLDPNYTVFGTMDAAGLAVVKKIAEAGTADGSYDGQPKNPVEILSVTQV